MKKILSIILTAAVLAGCLTFVSAAEDAIIRDGLVAYYDGANNSNGKQDLNATVWRDLSGNGYHFEVETDSETKWTENAFHSNKKRIYFNEGVIPGINAKQYTIEMAFGEMEFYGTDWLTLVASDNDEFSMFIRVQDGLDQLEYKYNDNNRDRPVHTDGKDLVNNSTLTVTFDIDEPICNIYIDGELICSGVPVECNIADTLFFGHENAKRSWQGDIYAFRFYDRVLSTDEIKHNSQVDNDKYRSGKSYTPEVVVTDEFVVTETEQKEYNIGDVITIADFSDPEMFSKMIKAEPQHCTAEMDDSGSVKITVTDADPYFYIPIDSSNSFDGDKFTTLIITYKTGPIDDDLGEIFYSTKYSKVYFTDNRIDLFLEEAADFTDLEIDMRDNDNDTWHNEIRMIRIDPTNNGIDQVYYIKSVKAKYEDPNKPIGTTAAEITEPAETTEAATSADTTADTEKTTDKTPDTTKETGSQGGSNTGLIIGIICGVVAVAVVIVIIIVISKKKK